MPTIVLRGVPVELKSRIQEFGRVRGLGLQESTLELARLGLGATDTRAKGGRAAQERRSPEERSSRAAAMAAARWGGRVSDSTYLRRYTIDPCHDCGLQECACVERTVADMARMRE